MNKFKSFGLIILLVMTVFLFSGCKDQGGDVKYCPPPNDTKECTSPTDCSNCYIDCPCPLDPLLCPDKDTLYCPCNGDEINGCPKCLNGDFCTDKNCCNCKENKGSVTCGCETDADCDSGETCKKAPGAKLGQCVDCNCVSCREGVCYCDAAGKIPAKDNNPANCKECSDANPCADGAECCNGMCCQVGWVCVNGQCRCNDDADCPGDQACADDGTCCAGLLLDGKCITPCPCASCKNGHCYCDAAGTHQAENDNPANCNKDCYDNSDCKNGDCCGGVCCSGNTPKCLKTIGSTKCGTSSKCVVGSNATYTCVECLTSNDCSGDTPYCVNNKCVQCKDNTDCPSGQVCKNGQCVDPTPCTARCKNDTTCCENGYCDEYGMCKSCPADSNCVGGCGNASCKCSGGTESTTGYCCPGGGSAPKLGACCGNVTPYKPSTGWASTVEEIKEQGCCKVDDEYIFAKSASGTCASTSCAGNPNMVVDETGKCVPGDSSNKAKTGN